MNKKILKLFGLFLFVMLTASCIRYHAKPITLPRSLADFDSRSLSAPELKSFLRSKLGIEEWPPPAWDVRSLTWVAIYFHPDMDVARAQRAVAEAGRITAGESPNPTLSVLMGYNTSSPVSEASPWIPEAALEIPIETAGKRGYRIAAARHLSEAARLGIIGTAWQVRSRLRGAFLDLFAAQETSKLLSHQQALQERSLKIMEAQLAAGEISAYEVTSARIALDSTRLTRLATAQEQAQSHVRLAAALGVPDQALEGADFSYIELQKIPSNIPAGQIRRQALLNRADILGALSEYAASQSALQLEIAKQYPDISLGPNFQLDQTDNKWTLGLSLILPIFSRNRGPIAEAEARRAESAARFQSLQAKVIADIEAAAAACQTATEKARVADEMQADIGRQEAAAQARFRIGEISRLELLGIQSELAAAAQARLDAVVKAQQAQGELEDAMQGPLDLTAWILKSPVRTSGQAKERKDE